MAKFRFAQEKQVTTWVRDYFEVEANSLDDAISMVVDAEMSLDELSYEDNRVEWVERDDCNLEQWSYEDNNFPYEYVIKSCDLDDEEIAGTY